MENLKALLEELMNKIQLQYSSIEEELTSDGIIRFNIISDEPQIVVGRHGETLFSLQHVFRLIVRRTMEEGTEVILDAGDYRKRQEEAVIVIAENKIEQLKKIGGVIQFSPMVSYKRRAIHVYIMENYPEIKTESVGSGLDRKLTIALSEDNN